MYAELAANSKIDFFTSSCHAPFNHRNARNYWIYEDSQLIAGGVVLSLLWWKDETQLIDIDREFEERGTWRSDFRQED